MNDPFRHPKVHGRYDNSITYRCGCVNEIRRPSGVLHSVTKCQGHRNSQRPPEKLGLEYYEELKAVIDGTPQCARYLEELREALGPFPDAMSQPTWGAKALEIGSGCSMYAPGLLARGYVYAAIDPSEAAVRWTSMAYDVSAWQCTFEEFVPPRGWDAFSLILAAHSLEHMEDAPAAIKKCGEMLLGKGELWIIVPNDDDPLNSDHMWFFNEETLAGCLKAANLEVLDIQIRQRVKHERFLYARAVNC